MQPMKPLVLSIPSYAALAAAIAERSGWEQGDVERKTFRDGETYQRLRVDVRERDVVLVAGTAVFGQKDRGAAVSALRDAGQLANGAE